ncbi:hypothetical protein J437_LFUL008253 [Ladona fulva]|uniref:Uncharacterized protein n=1 Tax=Ladona fulva TaxID=123851 RepID=A0A8K0P2A4_LADFU|nr:hypothetical protein J437_LFUL008253 [Ladona fulva]
MEGGGGDPLRNRVWGKKRMDLETRVLEKEVIRGSAGMGKETEERWVEGWKFARACRFPHLPSQPLTHPPLPVFPWCVREEVPVFQSVGKLNAERRCGLNRGTRVTEFTGGWGFHCSFPSKEKSLQVVLRLRKLQ